MDARQQLRLRQANGRGGHLEFAVHEAALHDELVHHDRLGPDTELWHQGEWVRLRHHPDPPWLDRMAEQAARAAAENDPKRVERYAAKVLRFSNRDDREAVRAAKFLLAHLHLCAGRHRPAVSLLEAAARVPSRFSAAAYGNLGVAWAHLRNPAAALEAFETALQEDVDLLTARLSLRNLAATLAVERAPGLPGRPGWAEIAGRESGRLATVTAAQVRALLRRPFPGYALWHVLAPGPYFPGLGSRLARSPSGRRAAARLLKEANQALADADYERARLLAQAVPSFNPAARPAADGVAAAAAAKLEEERLLARADRLVARLRAFVRDLARLGPEDLDAARGSLALLAPLVPEAELQRLYRECVERLLAEEVETASGSRRDRLLTVAGQYAAGDDAAAYRRAASLSRAEASLASLWKAVSRGDLPAAEAALERAARSLGEEGEPVTAARALLGELRAGDPTP